jgi:hypothetical protein
MKNRFEEIKKIVLRAAGEESSVFDVLSELRPVFVDNCSYSEFVDNLDYSISILEKFRHDKLIDVYNLKLPEKFVNSISDDIYNNILFIPNPTIG